MDTSEAKPKKNVKKLNGKKAGNDATPKEKGDDKKPKGGPKTDKTGKPGAKKSDKPKLEEMTVKERRKVRQASSRDNYQDIARMKVIWEQLRRQDAASDARTKLCADLYTLVEGKARQLIFAHDTS